MLATPVSLQTSPEYSTTVQTHWSDLVQACFGSRPDMPAWLAQPLHALQRAADRQRPLAARIADLVEMVDAIDTLFTEHVAEQWAWFHTEDAHALPAHEALPRWTEGLFGLGTQVLQQQIVPALGAAGLNIGSVVQTDESQRAWLHRHFMQRIYPRLTPLAVDSGRPFPFISSESLNLLVELQHTGGADDRPAWARLFARVKIPVEVPALIDSPVSPVAGQPFATPSGAPDHVWTADVVRFFVHHLFPGMPVRRVYLFRIVRGDTPLPGASRLAPARHRRQEDRPVVRVDVEQRMEDAVLAWLVEHLHVPAYAVARHASLVEWGGLASVQEALAASSDRA